MATITTTDLENAKIDVDDLADVVNGSETINGTGIVTTRLGQTIKTLKKSQYDSLATYVAYNNRGAWQTATAYSINDVWESSGTYYLVLVNYTSGANAAADIAGGKVVVHQPKDWVQNVQDVATLRLTEPAYDGQIIQLLGHTTAGKGGGQFRYDAGDTTTADDNGVTIVTTSGAKRWKRILNGFIDSDMFNGNVKSVMDNTTADYAVVLLDDYTTSSTINLPSNCVVDFRGNKLLPSSAGLALLSSSGSIGSFTALSVDLLKGGTFLQTSLVIPEGSWIFVRSQTEYPAPNNRTPSKVKMGQIFRVMNVVSSGVSYKLDLPSEEDFLTSATAEVAIITPKENIELRNVELNNDDFTTQMGIGANFKYVNNLIIKNFKATGSKSKTGVDVSGRSALKINSCMNVVIEKIETNNIGWYGLEVLGATRDLIATHINGTDCRHLISVNWSEDYGEPLRCSFNFGHASLCTLSGIDTHDRGKYIHFNNIISENSVADSGFQIRSNGVTLRDCEAYKNALNGFTGRDGLTAEITLYHCIAKRNVGNGFDFEDYGAKLIECIGNENDTYGFVLLGGKVIGGEYLDNTFAGDCGGIENLAQRDLLIDGVYMPYSATQTRCLFFRAGNGVFPDRRPELVKMINCNVVGYGSNLFITSNSSPVIFSSKPRLPIMYGNKLYDDNGTTALNSGFVTLSSGTASVSTTNVLRTRITSTADSKLSILPKIRLNITGGTVGENLNFVPKSTNNTGFDIYSSNASSTKEVYWELHY